MNKLFVFSALLLAGCSSESGSLFDNKNEYVDTGEDLPSAVSAMVDPNTEVGVMPYQPFGDVLGNSWELVFSDEFNGQEVDLKKWNIDNSSKSRAARERLGIDEWYWKPENVYLKDGNLVLEVHKTGDGIMTNGSINSANKFTTQYGYMECRVKIAQADKLSHTAFWLQGPNMANVNGRGNDGAEIDIFESAHNKYYVQTNLHYDGYNDGQHKSVGGRFSTPGIHDDFQVIGLLWTDKYLKIYYNGILKYTYNDTNVIPFVQEYLWLSNGASFGEDLPDNGFDSFEIGKLTESKFDYVRVWRYIGIAPLKEKSNLVVNGNFDAGKDGWTKGIGQVDQFCVDNLVNGNYYYLPYSISGNTLRLAGKNYESSCYQDIEVETGKRYSLEFIGRIMENLAQSKPDNTGEGNLLKATIESIEGDILGETLLELKIDKSEDTYMKGEFTATSKKIRLVFWKNDLACIDNVCIREINKKPLE